MSDYDKEKLLTEAGIAEIEARCNAATPGPWHKELAILSDEIYNVSGPRSQGILTTVGHVGQDQAADAEFVARAREDIPRLIATCRAVPALADDLYRAAGEAARTYMRTPIRANYERLQAAIGKLPTSKEKR